MEYLQLEYPHTFVTGEEGALMDLFGCSSGEGPEPQLAIKSIAQRLSTVFATLKARP